MKAEGIGAPSRVQASSASQEPRRAARGTVTSRCGQRGSETSARAFRVQENDVSLAGDLGKIT